jgi:hypothetical protein
VNLNEAGDRAVAAADVEYGTSGRDLGGQGFREDANTPAEDGCPMRLF